MNVFVLVFSLVIPIEWLHKQNGILFRYVWPFSCLCFTAFLQLIYYEQEKTLLLKKSELANIWFMFRPVIAYFAKALLLFLDPVCITFTFFLVMRKHKNIYGFILW